MTFTTPEPILTEIHQMSLASQPVAQNRAKINRLTNGDTPNTEEECREQNLKTNVNWLESTRICSNASNQVCNAFLKGDRYFTVRINVGPVRFRSQISEIISKSINQELKRCRAYKSAKESSFAQVVLHALGPLVWRNRRSPVPSTCGIDDILVPAGTLTSMENLDRFGIYREMTWAQLSDATMGDAIDPGWNKDYITALLATLYKTGLQPTYQGNRWMFPEKIQEDIKEGAAFQASNSLPKCLAWDFFYRNEDTGKWNRKMVADYANIAVDNLNERTPVVKDQKFLYEKDDYADDWQEIVHWYIGNCSNVAPYRYYSARSMGYLLYAPCMQQNKVRNRGIDHLMQQLLTWFHSVSEDGREKLGMIDLQNFGVLPDGVSMVSSAERHTIDPNLLMMVMSQNRQLMSESAEGFVPQAPGRNDQRTKTATEILVDQNTSISLTSAVLNQLSEQSKYEYREICRRFCIKNNPDPMAKRFREALKKHGFTGEILNKILDVEEWDIIPEQTVGGGNKAVELTVTQALMQEMFPLAGPDGQRTIARRRYLALTDNPDEANLVIPEAPQPPSDDVQYAQMAYSVLMMGIPFVVKEGVNNVAYTAMLMQLMQVSMKQAEGAMQQPAGIPLAADRIAGCINVGNHCADQIQIISRDKQRENIAKQLFKSLSEIMGALQNMGKQLMKMEQQMQPQDQDPETTAKVRAILMQAQTKSQIAAASAQEKQTHKDVAFSNENQRRNAMTQAEVQRKLLMTHADVVSKDLTTRAEIIRETNQPATKE